MKFKRFFHKQSQKKSLALAGASILLSLELVFLIVISLSVISLGVYAGIGTPNSTVTTLLQVGNVPPEIYNVTIQNNIASIDLTPNSTTTVTVRVYARDFNNETDIKNISAELFAMSTSSFGAADDNNDHYTNTSCFINLSYGNIYEVEGICNFGVQYYAHNASWNATVTVNDTYSSFARDSNVTTINALLSVGLPDSIDYGIVNASSVSAEQIANVTNYGNVGINLSLSGYAITPGDGLAMNCTLGATKNISIYYEQFNLTTSNPGTILNLTYFDEHYANLTSTVVNKTFNLNYRQNDVTNEAINATYWRIYVPTGVAGSCAGKIVFGASQAAGN